MEFIKKHRFTFLIVFLVLTLIIVSFYLLWVHVPYTNHQNDLTAIREEICTKNKYKYLDYFNEYNSDQTYYIIKVKDNKTTKYVVYNQKKKLVYSYKGKLVDKQSCLNDFKNRYKGDGELEIGYENSILVYSIKYHNDDKLTYAFYSVKNGEFIKAYKL